MSNDQSKIPENIRQQFPLLQPVKRAPSLFTVNGCGFGMYGKRDFDQATETYVKTRCISLFYVPLFAVGAYRVGDAGSRTWYFFGKESLSGFARTWNMILSCLLLMGGLALGWNIYTSSPVYRAQQEIKRAAELMQSGESLKAAGIYRQQISGPSATEARTGLKEAVEACLQSDKSQTVAGAMRIVATLPASVNKPEPLIADAFNHGLSLVAKFRTNDVEGALSILAETTPLGTTNDNVKPLRMDLLKESIAANPDNTNRVVELALIYEADEQLDESAKLLMPYQQRLGSTEGARILGQYLLNEGKHEDAYGLLYPYVHTRLDKLHGVESAYTNAMSIAYKRALDDLNEGRAPESFYRNYKVASKSAQDQLVDDYLQQRLESDPGFQRAVNQLKEANQIVHVALDLGIVQLNRAQSLKDPDARKAELEAAEKTFLGVRGFAGETDEYRLFLGQVYYWLGKSKEGKELFDQLLEANKRAYPILVSLSQTLRSVGANADARALAEEAYGTAKDKKEKFAAASLRSLLFKDTDDQIAWLEKSDTEDNWVQIELNSARGKKALSQGNKTQAAGFLTKAINGYDKLNKSAAVLNNCGLACFDLYEATGNVADQKRGLDLLEEAIRLAPSDSILLQNTLYFLISRAVADVVGDSIHTEVLNEQPSLSLLSYLYLTEPEREVLYQKLHDNENMKKSLVYLDRALLLAPKNRALYGTALAMHASFRDLPELQKLQQRFQVASPDFTEEREETLRAYTKAKDKENLEKLETQLKTYEEALQKPAVKEHPLTLEHATLTLIALQQGATIYGRPADSAKMLAMAQAAYQAHPCAASRSTLKSVYFFKANEELAAQNGDYAKLSAQTRHSFAPQYLIAFLLERGGPLADVARRNQYVAKGLAMEQEGVKMYPTWVSIEEWAFLGSSGADTAATIKERLKQNEIVRLIDELQFMLNPLGATSILEQYWTQKLLGDEKHAVEIYQQAAHDGVPLPPL